uniref:Uncharacterized protein n=1 Tax=Panagrolaimus davidi TaxID=227884 RepID=A0A914PHX5_9BILA
MTKNLITGATLQSLVPNYKNLKIDFEDDGVILLEGSPEQVNTASEALENEIERLSNGHRSEVVDQKLNHHAIEKHDTLMPKLKKNKNGVQINIPDESNFTISTNNITSDKTIRTSIKNIQAIIDDLFKQANKLEERLDKNEDDKDFYEAVKSLFKQSNDLLKKFDITLKWNSKANELDTLQEANISKNLKKEKTADPCNGVQRDGEFNIKIDSNIESKLEIPSFIFLFDGKFGIEIVENGQKRILKNIFGKIVYLKLL